MTEHRFSTSARVSAAAGISVVVLATLLVMRVGAFPSVDGVSYLDLSDAALQGRWHEFVSAYWSPLFPALISVVRECIGASPARESVAIAIVNIAAIAAAAGFFWSILRVLAERGALPTDGPRAVALHLVCWSAFAAETLRIAPATLSTPDALVFTAQLGALAAILRAARSHHAHRFAFAAGVALGVAFLAKGAVIVLGVAYIVAIALLVPRARLVRSTAITLAGFGVVAAPWIAVLSRHEGTLTVGSVARLNLAWYVGGQSSQAPNPDAVGIESLPHQWNRVYADPAIYDFSPHLAGTYPPWTDPTWPNVGLIPRPTLRGFSTALREGGSTAWSLFGVPLLAGLVVLSGVGFRLRVADARLTAAFALLALSQFLVYWPVHLETRFLGIAWLCAWLAVVTVAPVPSAHTRPTLLIAAAVVAVALWWLLAPAYGTPSELLAAALASAVLVFACVRGPWRSSVAIAALLTVAGVPWWASVAKNVKNGVGPVHRRDVAIAQALHDLGVADGAAVASINASAPASWARLGRWHLTAEVAQVEAPKFWRLDDLGRESALHAISAAGAAAVVGVLDDGAPVPAKWTVVPGTRAVILPRTRMPR